MLPGQREYPYWIDAPWILPASFCLTFVWGWAEPVSSMVLLWTYRLNDEISWCPETTPERLLQSPEYHRILPARKRLRSYRPFPRMASPIRTNIPDWIR